MNKEIVLFQDGQLQLEVTLSTEEETVWLSANQMAKLFQRDKSVISRHIKNIFKEEELDQKVVVAKNATTTKHGAIKEKIQEKVTEFYNLDVIISVGYRVNSKKGIAFCEW